MPDIAWGYQQGVKQAWNAPYLDHSRNGRVEIDSFAMSSATSSIARGHEATTILLLGAIVAYLTRNGGGAAGVAAENAQHCARRTVGGMGGQA
jgi:hypothetical protein